MKGSIFTLRLTVLVVLILSLGVYGYADFNDDGDQINIPTQLNHSESDGGERSINDVF